MLICHHSYFEYKTELSHKSHSDITEMLLLLRNLDFNEDIIALRE